MNGSTDATSRVAVYTVEDRKVKDSDHYSLPAADNVAFHHCDSTYNSNNQQD